MALYIVSTPIGNLKDMTKRAKISLSKMDIILAEDSRKTSNLLKSYQISAPKLVTYNDHNKLEKIPEVISWLKQGKKVALVSNAGTPVVSDPGYELVKSAVKEDIDIIPIPGPTALIAALTVSGFPPTRFVFLGFLPKSKKKKTQIFNQLNQSSDLIPTVIFYESPKRILKTLKVAQKTLGNIEVVICRELTKKFEEKIRGDLEEALENLEKRQTMKGEITVVLKLE